MFDVVFRFAEHCEEFYCGEFTVCGITCIDVDATLPVVTVAEVLDIRDPDYVFHGTDDQRSDYQDEIVQGLISSILRSPAVDLNISKLRRDAYSKYDPNYHVLPHWVFFVELVVIVNGQEVNRTCQILCKVKNIVDHGYRDGESSIVATIADGVNFDDNVLSCYLGSLKVGN